MEEEDFDRSEEQAEEEEQELDPAALREQLRAELETEYETRFQGHKTEFAAAEARRTNQRLRDTAGIEFDDEGNLRPVDAVRATQFAARAVGAPTTVDPLDMPIQPYVDDEDTIAAKLQRRDERLLAAARKEFREELLPYQQMAQQPLINGTERLAADALKQFMGEAASAYTEHPEFGKRIQDAARQAVKSGWSAEALSNPEAMAQLALSCVPTLPKQAAAEPAREREAAGRYLQDAQRASLRSTGPSRGMGQNVGAQTPLDEEDRRLMQDTGCESEEEYRALAAAQNGGGLAAYERFVNEKARRNAGRR